VIAEGIETPAQLAQLRARGCRFGQGYFLAPPMPADEALQLLRAERDMAISAALAAEPERGEFRGSGFAPDGGSLTIH